jgi:pyruvate dehydrogenase E2 component (dihydrolipoamide acetyltransferase)
MPSLGADMDAGTLLEWRIKPGDTVKRGDIVAVVETSKADIEIEVFEDGEVEELLVPEGGRVPVGTPLAHIRPAPGAGNGAATEPARLAAVAATAPEPVTPAAAPESPPAPPPPAPAAPVTGPRASPVARRAAAALGVDVTGIRGTGPHGAISKRDVERAAAAPRAEPPKEKRAERAAAMRQAIGALMARSKREIPHYYLTRDIDMAAATGWLAVHNLELPVSERLLAIALLVKATALATCRVPEMNGFWIDDRFEPGPGVHVGVAIALRGGGLVAPAIHDADARSLGELMRDLRDLVRRARAGSLRNSEMTDPTITVTNLGDQGVDSVLGVIYPPQVALVGFGRVAERPWAIDGMLGVRPVVTATVSGDHRATDGHSGAVFLNTIDQALQRPEEL